MKTNKIKFEIHQKSTCFLMDFVFLNNEKSLFSIIEFFTYLYYYSRKSFWLFIESLEASPKTW